MPLTPSAVWKELEGIGIPSKLTQLQATCELYNEASRQICTLSPFLEAADGIQWDIDNILDDLINNIQ